MKFLNKGNIDQKGEEMARKKKEEESVLQELSQPEEPPAEEEIGELTIADYLKAGYPCIFIRTEEDLRATSLVKNAIESSSKMIGQVCYLEWRNTTGLQKAIEGQTRFQNPPEVVQNSQDPVAALGYIQTSNKQNVVVYHNLRQFIQAPGVIQQLKDSANKASRIGSHIILVGASLDIPPELKSLITVYDLQLPNHSQLKSIARQLSDQYKKGMVKVASAEDIEECATAAVGLTAHQCENAVALSITKARRLDPRIVRIEKEQSIKKDSVLEFVNSKAVLMPQNGRLSLGGFDVLKDWIHKRRDALSPEAREYGLKFSKGILLVGVAGCGKSLAAKTIANYLRLPLLKFDLGKVFRSLVGSSEATVRSALKTAVAVSPAVLWMEEVEKSAAGSQSSGTTDSGTTSRVLSTLLTFMQENEAPLFFVGTANNVGALPPEFLRKGRFAEIWGVVEPNESERDEIWKIHLGVVRPQRVSEFDYTALVGASKGFTGAEIEGVVEEAMFDAWNDGRREINTEDLIVVCNKIVPQSVRSKESIDATREWMRQRARFVSSESGKKELTPESDDKVWRHLHTLNTNDTPNNDPNPNLN